MPVEAVAPPVFSVGFVVGFHRQKHTSCGSKQDRVNRSNNYGCQAKIAGSQTNAEGVP